MENPAPFDLNQAIANWRANLATSPAVRAADLQELETHLRDSVQALAGKGLSPREAFWVAANRAGDPAALCCEFDKLNPERKWLERILWMVVGIIPIETVYTLASVRIPGQIGRDSDFSRTAFQSISDTVPI